ncbi:MAG: hypothetical protein AB7S68_15115 [Polyangiaceae bacterium]
MKKSSTKSSLTLAWLVGLGLLGACASNPTPPPATGPQPVASGSANTLTVAQGEDPEPDPDEWGIVGAPNDPQYAEVVNKVVNMVSDSRVQEMTQRRGLSLLDVTWEDTGRAQGSALGPNISDVTLQVRYVPAGQQRDTTALMPVIRFPNFSDRTGDVRADKFLLRIGNQKHPGKLKSVPLTQVLKNLRGFLSEPSSVLGSGNLSAGRDSHYLMSAQAVFLPIPKKGKAEFNPVVFNYQSAPGSPAVLTILATRQGTSISVVENRPEDGTVRGWGQELYFNAEGQRAPFTAERKSDVEKRIAAQGGPKTEDDRSALQKGADVLFLIQVPLKHKNRGRLGGAMPPAPMAEAAPGGGMGMKSAAAPMDDAEGESSDVEQAVLGHGAKKGPFIEGNGLRLERDPNFPIRITVQFYKATSNGVVAEKDLDAIAKTIGGVYEHADFVGSLVIPDNDPARPTAWQKVPGQWFPW